MGKNRKQVLERQKEGFEQALKKRLAFLSEKGIAAPKIDKDPLVRKHKAAVKAVNSRLRSLADNEKRFEAAAKAKAERASAPREGKDGGKPEKAGKPKKGQEAGKAKKPKPEKKAAPAASPEGGSPPAPAKE
jgi:hypothetical protein